MACASSVLVISIHVSLNLLAEFIMDLIGVPWLHIRVKNGIDLLKGATLCLRICEEHLEEHDGTKDPEDNIGFPLDIMESRRDKVRQCKVENPVCGC